MPNEMPAFSSPSIKAIQKANNIASTYTCLDGIGEITIDGQKYELKEGESIVMPANHPHAVYAKETFKMILVVAFKTQES